jgi:hypothetical protein
MLARRHRDVKSSLAFAAVCAAALLMVLPAAAQSQHRGRNHGFPANEGRGVYVPPQSACIPLCSIDTTPCDPPQFKAADGRCGYPMNGP